MLHDSKDATLTLGAALDAEKGFRDSLMLP